MSLLTITEIMTTSECYPDREHFARAIEAAVIKKLHEQEPVAYMADDECGMSEFVDAYYVKLTGGQLPFPNAAEVKPLYLHPQPPEAK